MTGPRLLVDRRGSGAAEFALVLPLLLLLLFGIIDGGRWLWAFNSAEKATQVGARVATVTQVIPGGLAMDYVGQTVGGVTLTQGDNIPLAALGTIICTKPSGGTLGCVCAPGSSCPNPLTPINNAGWDVIVKRMQDMYAPITDANVEVDYSGSGLGYAGDPSGMNISPLITVKLRDLNFTPITFLMLTSIQAIPAASTTLTTEDGVGTQST